MEAGKDKSMSMKDHSVLVIPHACSIIVWFVRVGISVLGCECGDMVIPSLVKVITGRNTLTYGSQTI